VPEQGRGKRGHVPDQVRLAREALAAARAQAQAKGLRPGRAAPPAQAADQEALSASAVDTDGTAVDSSAPGCRPASGSVPEPRRDQDGPGELGQRRKPGLRGDSLRRVRRDDPQALGSAIEGLLDTEGWNLAAATGSVFGRWAQIVGADLAGHTQPESLRDGELTVIADSTAWATQLRLLAAQLVQRLNAELGTGTVQRVKVRGPFSSTRKPGEWRVRGGRGPRDTYG
jgi:predicted nucleic acid-binding Zn ribbon protein